MNDIQKIFPKYQKGEGLFSIMVFTTMIGIVIFLLVKLSPSFLEYKRISAAIDDVANSGSAYTRPSSELVGMVSASLRKDLRWIDLDLSKVMTVYARDERKVLDLNYEVEIPLFKGISALLHYKHDAVIKRYNQPSAYLNSDDIKQAYIVAAN